MAEKKQNAQPEKNLDQVENRTLEYRRKKKKKNWNL